MVVCLSPEIAHRDHQLQRRCVWVSPPAPPGEVTGGALPLDRMHTRANPPREHKRGAIPALPKARQWGQRMDAGPRPHIGDEQGRQPRRAPPHRPPPPGVPATLHRGGASPQRRVGRVSPVQPTQPARPAGPRGGPRAFALYAWTRGLSPPPPRRPARRARVRAHPKSSSIDLK